jgi:hypothetical protein
VRPVAGGHVPVCHGNVPVSRLRQLRLGGRAWRIHGERASRQEWTDLQAGCPTVVNVEEACPCHCHSAGDGPVRAYRAQLLISTEHMWHPTKRSPTSLAKFTTRAARRRIPRRIFWAAGCCPQRRWLRGKLHRLINFNSSPANKVTLSSLSLCMSNPGQWLDLIPRGKIWGSSVGIDPQIPPVTCPPLPQCQVVAPDLLGHGYSDVPVGLGWFDDIELVLKDL